MLQVSRRWMETYPRALVGLLILSKVVNTKSPRFFQEAKRDLETRLRERYAGYSRRRLKTDPVLAAYDTYYAEFRKTYHILLQLETVVFKEEPIRGPSPLVEAMFMAELDNLLLTAGHDLAYVEGSLTADLATGEESYLGLGEQERGTKSEDMMITDDRGILSTVIYGPDHRTRIRDSTQQVVFTVYAPEGISRGRVQRHLEDMEGYISLVDSGVSRELLQVYPR